MSDSNNQQPELPILNDDELEKILHPNNELFPDEIITPSNHNSTTPSNIEIIPNHSNDLQDQSLYNKSITLRHEPMTDMVRANNRQLGNYDTHPLLAANGLESDTALNELFPSIPSHNSSSGGGGMQQAIHNVPTVNPNPPVRPIQNHKARPAFVNKIWSMLNDSNNHEWIQWTDDGMSFIVTNRENFVHEVLPKYFKHNNFASFVRQLNMYGWHKIQDVKAGSIQASNEDKWEFENPNFIRGREDLLVNIVRQKGNSQTQAQGPSQSTTQNIQGQVNSGDRPMLHLMNEPSTYNSMDVRKDVSTVLNELEKIKYNQMAISKDLLRINKDNELLWKENMMARERHRTQQQTLEKIFRFLTSLVPHMDQKMLMDGIMNYSDGSGNNSDSNNNTNGDNGLDMNKNNDKSRFQEEMYNKTNNPVNDNGVAPVSPATELYNEINADGQDAYIHDHNTYNPYDFIPQRSRLLLKNRSNSSSSSNVPGVSSSNLNKDKISEIPFDEDDEDDVKIKEIPNISTTSDEDIVSSKFLGNLQANIDEQDLRIQHLENMVEGLSPIKESKNGKGTPGDNFSLQDYFTSDGLPDDATHQPNTMTPLFYDDKTLLHVGNNDLLNTNTDNNSNKRKATEMDPSVRIEELSPEPNGKRSKFTK